MNLGGRFRWLGGMVTLLTVGASADANPLFPGEAADPQIRRFGDRYWIYPTKDGRGFNAYSSADLTNWTCHADILTTHDVAWARDCLWAPDAQEKDGRYYLFFSANDPYPVDRAHGDLTPQKESGHQKYGGIGVAVADRPEGPFRDLIGKPLVDRFWNRAQPIDQYVFTYRGDWYMVYGGWGRCNLVKLAPDFKSLLSLSDGQICREITPKNYTEGSVLFERRGVWYFMYSGGCWLDDSYCVHYSTASSPFGPFTYGGKALSGQPPIGKGAGHHSVICLPGTDDWYICYHRRNCDQKGSGGRQTCLDRMRFGKNGEILPIAMTK